MLRASSLPWQTADVRGSMSKRGVSLERDFIAKVSVKMEFLGITGGKWYRKQIGPLGYTSMCTRLILIVLFINLRV